MIVPMVAPTIGELAPGIGGNQAVHEVEELDASAAPVMH
jgi:hypothetical protein